MFWKTKSSLDWEGIKRFIAKKVQKLKRQGEHKHKLWCDKRFKQGNSQGNK